MNIHCEYSLEYENSKLQFKLKSLLMLLFLLLLLLLLLFHLFISHHLLIDSPTINSISVPSNQHVEGQMASLTCTVDENPAPADSVTWQLDGVVVTGSSFSNPVSTLNVNTSQSTAGNYHCVANNGIGEEAVSDERPLTVLCKYCMSMAAKSISRKFTR